MRYCERNSPVYSEFLIHAADVEGLCQGIDEELVSRMLLNDYIGFNNSIFRPR